MEEAILVASVEEISVAAVLVEIGKIYRTDHVFLFLNK
jgi:response regulator RpfG family c-di-GMP phosphodiesterase